MTEPYEDKDDIIVSLRMHLRQEREKSAHWICKYYAEENRFQQQNKELGQLRAAIGWIKERYEAEWTNEPGVGEVIEEIIQRLEAGDRQEV